MTPLERYEAYKKSKGLSETPATVTRPQSYNITTGGISQAEKTNIQRIKDSTRKILGFNIIKRHTKTRTN